METITKQELANLKVSIQLMSPASGDPDNLQAAAKFDWEVSIQLMSPASGDY